MTFLKNKNTIAIISISMLTSTPAFAAQSGSSSAAGYDPSFRLGVDYRYTDQATKGIGLQQKNQFENLLSSRFSLREYFDDPQKSSMPMNLDLKAKYKSDHENFFNSVDQTNNCAPVNNSIRFSDTGWTAGAKYQRSSDLQLADGIRYDDRVNYVFDKYGSNPNSYMDISYNSCFDPLPANDAGQRIAASDTKSSPILYGLLGIAALGGIYALADSDSPASP